jgi:hypothetical protein
MVEGMRKLQKDPVLVRSLRAEKTEYLLCFSENEQRFLDKGSEEHNHSAT